MTIRAFLNKLSLLILSADDDSKDWAKSAHLRSAWNWFFLTTIAASVLNIALVNPLSGYLSGLSDGGFWLRAVKGALIALILLLLFRLTVAYYSYTLKAGRPIDLRSVAFFYATTTIFFGMLYFFTFLVQPDYFTADHSRVIWYPLAEANNPAAWIDRMYFILYSAFKSVGISFHYIEAKSVAVSAMNYIQTIYSFCLVSLFVAGYVNQKAA